MSRVHRLLTTDRIFFVTVNLRRALAPLADDEFRLVAAAMGESRQRLHFLLCGYVLMPDHWHALIGTAYPLTISRVVQHIKWISARALNDKRRIAGPVWRKGPRHRSGAVATIAAGGWRRHWNFNVCDQRS